MRPSATITTFLAAGLAAVVACACTSSSGTPDPPMSAPHTTVVPETTPPPTVSTSRTSPPHPNRPTVPADVPRTGPNTRKGERPPVMPVAATKHSADGAQAFAEFFIKTIDWGYATTSSAYMRHYFARCDGCREIAAEFDRDRQSERHYIGDRYRVRAVKTINADANRARMIVAVSGTAGALIGSDHKPIRGDQAVDLQFGVTCEWRRTAWVVRDLGVVT